MVANYKEFIFGVPRIYQTFQKYTNGNYKNILASEWIQSTPTCRVLDVGCGPADIVTHLNFAEYVGIDLNKKYIRAAHLKRIPNTRFICESVDNLLNHNLGSFDRILILGVLHHLSDSQVSRLLQVLKRLITEGGTLITCDPAVDEGQSRVAYFLATHDRGKFVRCRDQYCSLIKPYFNIKKQQIRNDVLRVPNTQFITQSSL